MYDLIISTITNFSLIGLGLGIIIFLINFGIRQIIGIVESSV